MEKKKDIKKLIEKQKNMKLPKLKLGGASFYGLSDLILLEGTMRDFSYAQALEFYKENYEKLNKKK